MNRLIYTTVFIFLLSCSDKNRFPELVSEKVPDSQIEVLEKLKLANRDSNFSIDQKVDAKQYFNDLNHFQDLYFKKDSEFNLENFEKEWTEISANINYSKLNLNDAESWFKINGTLTQITGDAKYAEEMQQTLLQGFSPQDNEEYKEIENLVAPYIFTKNVDHIHVNIYTPAELQFEHTLEGHVKVWQETDFPDSENMTINFSMEKQRYIEVFVRIPSWAKGTTVTAMGVKYFAPPGDYTFIARKWTEGDKIEIHFPKKQKMAGL